MIWALLCPVWEVFAEQGHLCWGMVYTHFKCTTQWILINVNTCVLTDWAKSFSRVLLFVTLWTTGCQTPLPRGFSGQETEVGCISSSRRSSHPGIKLCLLQPLCWQTNSLPLSHLGKPIYLYNHRHIQDEDDFHPQRLPCVFPRLISHHHSRIRLQAGCSMHRICGDGSTPGFMKEMNDCISEWLLIRRRWNTWFGVKEKVR